ncbi:hypothetical protein LINPERHAP1_LOCUS30889 [Linum perenne]
MPEYVWMSIYQNLFLASMFSMIEPFLSNMRVWRIFASLVGSMATSWTPAL